MRLISALFVLVLGLVGVCAPATGDVGQRRVEERGSGCYNFGCAGKSPTTTGCANDPYVRTVTSRAGYDGSGRVEAKYSQSCHSYWARFVPSHWTPPCLDYGIQVQVGVLDSSGHIVVDYTRGNTTGDDCSYFWTSMVGAGNRYVRVRSGYMACGGGVCTPYWSSWGPWGKF